MKIRRETIKNLENWKIVFIFAALFGRRAEFVDRFDCLQPR